MQSLFPTCACLSTNTIRLLPACNLSSESPFVSFVDADGSLILQVAHTADGGTPAKPLNLTPCSCCHCLSEAWVCDQAVRALDGLLILARRVQKACSDRSAELMRDAGQEKTRASWAMCPGCSSNSHTLYQEGFAENMGLQLARQSLCRMLAKKVCGRICIH